MDSSFISNSSKMTAKKIATNLIIFGIIIFIVDFAIGRTLRFFYFQETSGLYFRTTYSMETTKADILVFGASRANHHYVPGVFEDSLKMSFYNTGRDGNGVFFQTALLKSVLKRYTPKVIILDYAGGFEKGGQDYDRLSSLLPYYRTHKEIRSIVELKSPFERVKLLSEIYPFNSQIITIAMGNLEINKKRSADNKGYVALYKEWQTNIGPIKNFTAYEKDPNKINTFKQFLSLAKESGAKVFVIYSPIFQKFNKNQEIDICKEICATEKVPFWNYSEEILFLNNNHLFQDVGHLNNNGAIVFSNLIVKKIKNEINKF